MDFYTSSFGLRSNPQISTLLKVSKLKPLAAVRLAKSDSAVFLGWGYKPNTLKTRELATTKKLPYWALEDGFIGWLKHPALAKAHERLSYVIDKTGMYYDASKPSGLDALLLNHGENLAREPLGRENLAGQGLGVKNEFDESRIERLLQQLVKLKISKYNQARSPMPQNLVELFADESSQFTLLVDQTFNDASIEYSMGSADSFKQMLLWGLEKLKADTSQNLILKVHPDVILGKKSGYLLECLKQLKALNPNDFKHDISNRIIVLSDDVSPTDLISNMNAVATVSSQLGFEALWQGKEVHCFAWPFYAGRGLTHDHNATALSYSRPQISLHVLLHGALILYPTYLHPDTQLECGIEDILDYIQAHFLARQLALTELNINDVSLWKRSFIPEFLSSNIKKITFNKSAQASNSQQLYWGMKQPQKNAWRMEDGFIRSVGLGADLRRPMSLIIDDLGVYYNGKSPSSLERLLNNYELNDYELNRAQSLLNKIRESEITKYNVEVHSDSLPQLQDNLPKDKEIILVAGQFQGDLSMDYGAEDIRDNLSLLKVVRTDFPNAFIIYKEHPDVYSGVRPGKLEPQQVEQFADLYVSDTPLTGLFNLVDRVCTICSLSGFEALLRGIKVSTYGLPFYAGWGLTQDKYQFERRYKHRSLLELLYISYVLYARYVSWNTRQLTTVESCIDELAYQRQNAIKLKTNWLARQSRKLQYLSQALLKRRALSNSYSQVRRCQ